MPSLQAMARLNKQMLCLNMVGTITYEAFVICMEVVPT